MRVHPTTEIASAPEMNTQIPQEGLEFDPLLTRWRPHRSTVVQRPRSNLGVDSCPPRRALSIRPDLCARGEQWCSG